MEYKKLLHHDQILLRPETYIGSVNHIHSSEPVWLLKEKRIQLSEATFSEGLLQIFIEILSNAIDNVWRSKKNRCSQIKVNIDTISGKTSIWNDGSHIPVMIHPIEKMYVPEMIFGNLLTSSNYDDEKERKTSGRNGIGAKATNIFSSFFEVEISDQERNLVYTQLWENNMKTTHPPVIKQSLKKGTEITLSKKGTKITWIPDFKRFGMKMYDEDCINMMKKRVYDTAMICSVDGVKVFLDNEEVPVKCLRDYVSCFYPEPPQEILFFDSSDSHVVLAPFDSFVQISFVNGSCTSDGGVHVDDWTDAIFKPIADKINTCMKKKKSSTISQKDVKQYFALFVNATLDKPKFTSQTKTKLSGPHVSSPLIKKSDIDKLMKWEFVETIKNKFRLKSLDALDKIGKKRGISGNVIHANFSKNPNKKKERHKCILCITEGLSALGYVTKGISYGLLGVAGNDYFGALAIRGKLLNVRNCSSTTITKNKEVQSLVEALGLQSNVDYTQEENQKNLKYGKLLVCADSDADGIHIVGLVYNLFHQLYPSLLKTDFFHFLRTPIVKVNQKEESVSFFYLAQAHEFIDRNHVSQDNIHYLKGLGSSTDREIKKDFSKNLVAQVVLDEKGNDMMEKIFDKKRAEFRKTWITSFEGGKEKKEPKLLERLNITDFLNQELITFSVEDCKRSIPSLMDGLKESQRKLLYSAFKRKLNKEIKVSRFTKWAAGDTNYHHGEEGLDDTLKNMGQRFVGSNNIPLFYDGGSFGSRLTNGEDAANGRYITTKLDFLTRILFPEEDDVLLENIFEEGMKIEKKVYVPILCMALVNGTMGIGTGFSSTIPSYNSLDIMKWQKTWIQCKGKYKTEMNGMTITETEELIPWWKGFLGTTKIQNQKIVTTGKIEEIKDSCKNKENKESYKITELPIGKKNLSILKYESILEKMTDEKEILRYDRYGSANSVHFVVYTKQKPEESIVEFFGLTDCVHTSNMVLFSSENKLKKYKDVEEILHEFCCVRLQLYGKRKEYYLDLFSKKLEKTRSKIRFIQECQKRTLILEKKEEEDVWKELAEKKYYCDEKTSYDYLLKLTYKQSTKKAFALLQKEELDLQAKIENLKNKTKEELWLHDLDIFETKYNEWLKIIEKENEEVPTQKNIVKQKDIVKKKRK